MHKEEIGAVQDFRQRILAKTKSLTQSQRALASFFTEQYEKAAFMSSLEIAQAVGVSESTVVRFAYVLGYNGFPPLRTHLQDMVKSKLAAADRISTTGPEGETQAPLPFRVMQVDIECIQGAMAQNAVATMEQAVSALLKARRVVMVAARSAKAIAQFFSFNLRWILPAVEIATAGPDEVCEHLLGLKQGDVVVGISVTRYVKRTVQGMQVAKERGATTVAITDSVLSPLAGASDHVLLAPGSLIGFADSFVAALSVVNALLVMISVAQQETSRDSLRALERIWERFDIFTNDSPPGGGGLAGE